MASRTTGQPPKKRVLTEAQRLAKQAYNKAYRAAHRETLNAKDRQRRLAHGEAIRAREKVSRQKP